MRITSETILIKLTKLIIKLNTRRIELDSLYNDSEIGEYIRNIQIDSPFQKLISKNVLSIYFHSDTYFIEFTNEQYQYYCLYLYLLELVPFKQIIYYLKNEENNRIIGLENALIYYFEHYINEENSLQTIEYFLEDIKSFNYAKREILFLEFKTKGHSSIESLLKNKSISKVKVLINLINKLEKEYKREELNNLSSFIISNLDPKDGYELLLYSNCLKNKEKKLIIEFIYNFLNPLINSCNQNSYHLFTKTLKNTALEILKYSEKEQALTLLLQCLKILNKFNSDKLQILKIQSLIAMVQKGMGSYSESLKNYINIYEEQNLRNDFISASVTGLRISEVYKIVRNTDLALKYALESLEFLVKEFGNFHLITASAKSTIGSIFIYQDKYIEALPFINESMNVRIQALGKRSTKVCTSYLNLSIIYRNINKLEESKELLDLALDIRIKKFGEEHQDVAIVYFELGLYYKTTNELNISLDNFKICLGIREKILGETHILCQISRLEILKLLFLINLDEAIVMKNLILKLKTISTEDQEFIIEELNKILE